MRDRQPASPNLPGHDGIGRAQRTCELSFIVIAGSLVTWQMLRLASALRGLSWWQLLLVGAGLLCADFASGLVHWTADSWGRESMPVLGRRFLRPFRVHHVNPNDFLRRDFVDTNGDVSMLVIPLLVVALRTSPDGSAGVATTTFLTALAAGAWLTNQVHQWAHMPNPPLAVRWLQNRGIILSRAAHRRHHESPFTVNYCIATGWLNRPLAAIAFFPRLERLVTAATGYRPRADEEVFLARLDAPWRGIHA